MTDAADPAMPDAKSEYRVLARKYRPQTFDDLIGQDALVRTLTNAFAQNRIHHAFVLTGVRGVGKTTTARIVAKGLNCIGPDGTGGPTMTPCGVCDNCRSIAEDRHVDVLEMDAASHTGVDDIRDLIEGARYRPVSARYKVYIVDEVHMLSRNAFNALLKTLEEPPEHVKFIFATTEIRKVPITVLSRCQRFDLKRIDVALLVALFAKVARLEEVEAEEEALRMVARAADGSARDGLSILDQAMALADGPVTVDRVRDMLGLVDRSRVYDLFEAVMRGRVTDALDTLRTLYDGGVDPVVVLQDLMELTHAVTRMKAAPQAAGANDLSEVERDRGKMLADALPVPALARAWQMLAKGLGEVQAAPVPIAAVEMVLIRLAHAADLPDPAELVRLLSGSGEAAAVSAALPSNAPPSNTPTHSTAVTNAGAAPPDNTTPTDLVARADDAPAPMVATPEVTSVPPPAAEGPPAHVVDGPPPVIEEIEESDLDAGHDPVPVDFAAMVELVGRRREPRLKANLQTYVHCIAYEPGLVVVNPQPAADRKLLADLPKHLSVWTGRPWRFEISEERGEATLKEREDASQAERKIRAAKHPVVARVLELFPGAEIEAIAALPEPEAEALVDEPMIQDPIKPDQASEA